MASSWGLSWGIAWGDSWGPLPACATDSAVAGDAIASCAVAGNGAVTSSGTVYGGTAGRVPDKELAKIKAWLQRTEKPRFIPRRKKLNPPSIDVPKQEIFLVSQDDDEDEILLLS